jgi:hypothetical protein
MGFFGSLDATEATKRNANAGFGPFDAIQARQRLRPGSAKKVQATNRAPAAPANPLLIGIRCCPCALLLLLFVACLSATDYRYF